MSHDSTPAFALEKAALRSEIENGIQAGVERLDDETIEKKKAEQYHNTQYLLKQYRRVAYSVQVSESDLNLRMEMEHGLKISTMEINAELAGVDLSGSKLESYTRTVFRSKSMLKIIDNALEMVRMDPDQGEFMYQLLYLTYFTKQKPRNREEILSALDREGFAISLVTYHKYLKIAIHAIDRLLWGYTARDCMDIIKQFLP